MTLLLEKVYKVRSMIADATKIYDSEELSQDVKGDLMNSMGIIGALQDVGLGRGIVRGNFPQYLPDYMELLESKQHELDKVIDILSPALLPDIDISEFLDVDVDGNAIEDHILLMEDFVPKGEINE